LTGQSGGILRDMNRHIIIPALLALIFTVPSMAEDIYKWEDESGQVHYSDVPRDGAEEVEVAPIQTFSAPAVASNDAAAADETEAEPEVDEAYDSLAITSPRMEETIWNTGGTVTVKMSLDPSLRTGHSLRLYMDDQQVAELPPRVTSIRLSAVERGSHTLRAEVRDGRSRMLMKSDQVKFHFKQQTADNALRTAPAKPAASTKPQRTQKNIPRPTPR
jgi:hypothetical protein